MQPEKLVRKALKRHGEFLEVCGRRLKLGDLGRVAVVGAGKAGRGMAVGVEKGLGDDIVDEKVLGWVNVPAGSVADLRRIHLHAARPETLNEPTEAGVEGSRRIIEIAAGLTEGDLCIVLLSGGGSALLPYPVPFVPLADKQAITRLLSENGATIQELNAVRARLSRIKGGGLARASRAGSTVALIISDVVGDPIESIASGPTALHSKAHLNPLEILGRIVPDPPGPPSSVISFLRTRETEPPPTPGKVENHIIGNNELALRASAAEAERLGYRVVLEGSENTGEANSVGRSLADRCRNTLRSLGRDSAPVCLLSGGEPIVELSPTDRPRKGGRNQQLVLAALQELWIVGLEGITILSGGTDGEDGPTDAAGAFADEKVRREARSRGLEPAPFLEINDSYGFFKRADGLFLTGPTGTNVMDLRVALIRS